MSRLGSDASRVVVEEDQIPTPSTFTTQRTLQNPLLLANSSGQEPLYPQEPTVCGHHADKNNVQHVAGADKIMILGPKDSSKHSRKVGPQNLSFYGLTVCPS